MALNFDENYDWDLPAAGPSRSKRRDSWDMDEDPPQRERRANASRDVIPQAVAEETFFQQLIRHWMNERHAQEGLLGRLLDHIKKQVRLPYRSPMSRCSSSGSVLNEEQLQEAQNRVTVELLYADGA